MGKANDYDFYAESISKVNRSGANRAHAYIEKPAMVKLLPELTGKKVLSLGCGTGEECGMLLRKGAVVTGVDSSRSSIDIARETYPGCRFKVMDIHDLEFADNSFDFVYSSLVIHYAEDLSKVMDQIYRVLKPGGIALLSTLHPVKWAAAERRDSKDDSKKSFILGYDSFSYPSKVYGDYLHTNKKTQKPAGYPTITYWIRPISDYIRLFTDKGFELQEFVEPSPIPETKKEDPDYWRTQSRIPQFMIFKLKRSDGEVQG